MRADTPTRRRKWFSLTPDTKVWDDDVLWELPVKERKRVKNAMTWGRPLPPRLARVAVQHASMMQDQAWYGRRQRTLGLVSGGIAAALASFTSCWPVMVAAAATELLTAAIWFRAVARARRA